jgi:DNA-binding FadR family transcriptional regulator
MTGSRQSGAHERLVSSLGTSIVTGEFQPGQDLDPMGLGKQFGVSRTAMREALRVLMAKGLVDARPKRGTFVTLRRQWNLLDADVLRWRFDGAVDDLFLTELAEVRLMVEPMAASLAAKRRTDRDLADLEDALAALRRSIGPDATAQVEADFAFHAALLDAAHNELLTRMATVIEAGMRLRDRYTHGSLDTKAVELHAKVLLAVRNKRSRAAHAAMSALIDQSIVDTASSAAAKASDDE